MFLERFYDDELAQASYLLGCEASGAALVVDANRDVAQYVSAAAARGARITHVTETHIHADFVSGSRELAGRTGAALLLSDEGGPDWRYAFAGEAHARLLRDGDSFAVGRVRVDVMHTPGHTPEHLVFLVTDGATADRPMGAFTGDFVFVGDVGRPDLLERAAHFAGTMESSARTLHRSLRRFLALPDYLQLWPGHGAGSACGKALGAVPQTTLGYERLFNWALTIADENEFVAMVLAGQPDAPRYFAEMKRVNRDGPRVLGGLPHPERVPASRLAALLDEGAIVVDVRHPADFAEVHVPGTLNIPLNRAFSTWAGSILPYDRDVHLLTEDDDEDGQARRAARALALIGLDRVAGYLGTDAFAEWTRAGRSLESVPQLSAGELRAGLASGRLTLVDVRSDAEWEAGRLAGAVHIPLGALPERVHELARDAEIAVQCQGGTRSAIAASLLLASGYRRVHNVAGGMSEWERGGFSVQRDGSMAARHSV